MNSVYFSCLKFTVRLVVRGTVIVEAAPIVKTFEGQTIGALTTWAHDKFGGPIVVQKLSGSRSTSESKSLPRQRDCDDEKAASGKEFPRVVPNTSFPLESVRRDKDIW